MNHAAYIKLRGACVRFAPPIPTVSWVTVGSTDFSMWNEWTIGKSRYIDRDNGGGVFVEGEIVRNGGSTTPSAPWRCPSSGPARAGRPASKDNDPLAYLWGTDWAFALKLESRRLRRPPAHAIGTLDPGLGGRPVQPRCAPAPPGDARRRHAVGLVTRFRGVNGTLDGGVHPSQSTGSPSSGLLACSSNYVNPDYATNMVRNGQGFSPVVFKTDAPANPIAAKASPARRCVELFDPFEVGLSPKVEYFNIGTEYNAIMGARREADVLLTDGIITGGFTRGGQLPTLNIANEFLDWDEPWYESVIGWHGVTGVLEYVNGGAQGDRRVHLHRLQHQHAGPGREEPVPRLPLHERLHRHDRLHGRRRLRERVRPRQGPAQRLPAVPGPLHHPGRAERPELPALLGGC